MNKKLLWIILIAICFTSSCSWMTNFVIVNKSDGVLEIEYKYRESSREIKPPQKKSAQDLKKYDARWESFPSDRLKINQVSKTVQVRLEPNETLLVESETNYTGHDSNSGGLFPIESLSLSGKRGSAKYEGRQVLTQFREESETLYTIIYE